MRDGDGDRRAVSARRAWLDNTTMALVQMCAEVVSRLPKGQMRDEAAGWCAVLPRIDAIQAAAKPIEP